MFSPTTTSLVLSHNNLRDESCCEVPATKTKDLASYRCGWMPPEASHTVCHANGPSKAGFRSPSAASPEKARPQFRTIFAPVHMSETIGKAQPGQHNGVRFSSMTVTETLPDYSEGMRQKRMLQNMFPDYAHSIEGGALKKVPKPAKLHLNFHPVRPYQKMNRFDGSPCRRDEN